MITIKRFTFNPFQENTYVLSDETKECIIIDAGMDGYAEENEFLAYISQNGLKPKLQVNTHCHIDHILGNSFISKTFKVNLAAHKDGSDFIERAQNQAAMFGLSLNETKDIDEFIDESCTLKFGNSSLKILLTPGHADGSLCFYSEKDKFVISGDVLFYQSIGRTDLPTGNYDILQKSIWEKLFTLPDDTVVYPGHGPETTIGFEKTHNPFVAIGKE